MISLGVVYLLIADLFLAAYRISTKQFDQKLILIFWASTFTYLGYIGTALFKEKVLLYPAHAWKHIMFDYTFINIPFYCAAGLSTFLFFLLYAELLKNYEISLIVPILKISMLVQTFGYLILGQKFHLLPFIGVIIVFFGAIISVWPSPSPQKFSELKKKFPTQLLLLALAAAFLKSLIKILVFLITQKTPVTEQVKMFLDHVFHHSHSLTLTFVNPFDYNIGVRFFIVLSFLIYIIGIKKEGYTVIKVLCEHFWKIIIISCFLLGYVSLYYTAYGMIADKIIISPLIKLALPIILITSYYFLNEKITPQKIIGYSIIIAGAIVSIL